MEPSFGKSLSMGNQVASNTAQSSSSYKEYLRSQFIYKDFKDLELRSFPALVSHTTLHFLSDELNRLLYLI